MSHAFPESARMTPIVATHDVVVCGGGPAGVAAAIRAGREGARTVLLEAQGCLGGIWTAGLLSWILDTTDKGGLLAELFARLEARGAKRPAQWRGSVACDPEAIKLLLEELCLEAGVRIRLHTRVVAAARDEAGGLAVAITESKSGREAWAGATFIDATGDGDLAAQAGCGFDLGEPGPGRTMPLTLMGLLGGLRYEAIVPYVHEDRGQKWREDSDLMLARLAGQGFTPSYGAPILVRLHDDLYLLMANHQYGQSGLDADALTAATLAARAETNELVRALRASGPPFDQVKLVATGAQIGVREGRRIHGLYQVSTDDLVAGRRHDDAVCRVTFPVDVHSPDPKEGTTYVNRGVRSQPYDIPLRALLSRDVPNLLLAGRCISGDHLAHSSYRVTGNAVALGEAAGVCAALAVKAGIGPREVPAGEVIARLAEPA